MYAEAICCGLVEGGQGGNIDRWLREGGVDNKAAADLTALATSVRMKLSEAKMFVKAVLDYRVLSDASPVPVSELPGPADSSQSTVPTITSPRTTVSTLKSAASGCHTADTNANDNTDLSANAKSTIYADQTAVRDSTAIRRGVLASGFRLVSLSDEELTRRKTFAGESCGVQH